MLQGVSFPSAGCGLLLDVAFVNSLLMTAPNDTMREMQPLRTIVERVQEFL
jgi:hypothetical protein